MNTRLVNFTIFLVLLSINVLSGTGFASGFALIEQGVSGLGNAYAGGTAIAQDGSTIFFNPAGMTRIPSQFIGAANVIIPNFKFKNEGSTHLLQPITDVPLLGGNGGDAGVMKVAPNLYFVKKVNDQISFGLGINSPFGLTTDYDQGWVGRYYAVKSELLTININPSIAYRFNEQLSIGAGLNIGYVKADLSNAIDFGTLDAIGRLGLPAGALGLTPQRDDGLAELKGDAWGLGWNAGILYEYSKDTRVGIAYRSQVSYTLKGDADFYNVPAGLRPLPIFKSGGIEAKLKTPDSLSLSFFHSFHPQWAIMGDVTWTNWRTFDELRIEFDNPNQPDSVVTTNWDDTFRFSLGATFTPTDAWTFRVGAAYDQAPTPNERMITPRIPDNDRLWLASGVGYKFTNSLIFNFGYAHLFINDAKIYKSVSTPEDAVRGGLRGKFSGSVDIVSAELQWIF
jgi:long-chain fatty acid transport protein